jgi:hypothetical protein
MRKLEEYAHHAEECQHKADCAKDVNEKSAWLRLTQSWLWMTQTEVDLLLESHSEEPPEDATEEAASRRDKSH